MTDDMILLDGVRYHRYEPKSESEFERMVVENAREIFGGDAIYLDIKKLIKTEWGKGTIPDGYLFYPEQKRFVLVEVELSSHPVYEHISKQVNKFISAFSNYKSRQKLASVLKDHIEDNPLLIKRIQPLLGMKGLYEFLEFEVFEPLADSKAFEVFVIIEDETPAVIEALSWLNPHPQLIEVTVYAREGAETVKAMRFVPQYQIAPRTEKLEKEQETIRPADVLEEMTNDLIKWFKGEFVNAAINKAQEYTGLAILKPGAQKANNICEIHTQKTRVKLHIRLEYDSIIKPTNFTEKVGWLSWWSDGDTVARIRNRSELDEAKRLISLAYEQLERQAILGIRKEQEPFTQTKVVGKLLPSIAYKLPILAVLLENNGHLHRSEFLYSIGNYLKDIMTNSDFEKTPKGQREIWKDHAASRAYSMKKEGLILCENGEDWYITTTGRKYYEGHKNDM